MVFSSLLFIVGFLPIFLAVYYASPRCLKNLVALVASYLFYAWGEPLFAVFLLASSLADYFLSRVLARQPADRASARKAILVVSLVLAGQSKLRTMLRRDALEDVARRLALIGTLRLLSRDETRDYLEHRLRLGGATAELFDHHAIEAVYEATQGNLRAIDSLALRSLQLAAAAGDSVIDARQVTNARAQVWP